MEGTKYDERGKATDKVGVESSCDLSLAGSKPILKKLKSVALSVQDRRAPRWSARVWLFFPNEAVLGNQSLLGMIPVCRLMRHQDGQPEAPTCFWIFFISMPLAGARILSASKYSRPTRVLYTMVNVRVTSDM